VSGLFDLVRKKELNMTTTHHCKHNAPVTITYQDENGNDVTMTLTPKPKHHHCDIDEEDSDDALSSFMDGLPKWIKKLLARFDKL
jgi:hypothetical protein